MHTPVIKKRELKTARKLNCYLPGLGHLYAGDFAKAISLMFGSILATALTVTAWAIDPHRTLFYLALLVIAHIASGIWSYLDIKKVVLQTREDYRLKDYNRKWIYFAFYLTYGFAITPVAVISIQLFVSNPFGISSSRSAPTLLKGDQVLSSKLPYRNANPQIGDIIIFKDPQISEKNYVRRVIAKGGDTVEIKGNQVLINGALEEKNFPVIQEKSLSDQPLVTLNPSELFVLGDNRDESKDSRHFGPISLFSVDGKVTFRYWPLSRFGSVE